MLNLSHADDISKISKYVDSLGAEIQVEGNNKYKYPLFQIRDALNTQKEILNRCIAKEKEYVATYQTQLNNLIDVSDINYIIAEKNKRLKLLRQHQDTQKYCLFINSKIESYNSKITKLIQKNHGKSLFKKNESIFVVIQELSQSFFTQLPFGFIKKYFIEQTISGRSLFVEVFVLLLIIFCKLLGRYQLKDFRFLRELSVKRYIYVVTIYVLFAPVQYLALKLVFFDFFGEELIHIFKMPITNVISMVFISYLYFFYKSRSCIKDCLSLLLYALLWLLLIHNCCEIIYLKLNNYAETSILSRKMMMLVFFQPMIFIHIRWMYIKILSIDVIYYKYLYLVYIFCVFIFILGSTLYINLAINLDFLLIINSVFITWVLALIRIKKIIIDVLNNQKNQFQKILTKIFMHRKKIALLQLKSLLLILYNGALFFLTISVIGNNFWYALATPMHIVLSTITTKYQFVTLSISFLDIIQGFIILLFLNLINFAISNYYANNLFKDRTGRDHAYVFFNWVGYAIEILIILKFLGFDLQNIFILLGGLSLGIGLGLKNIFSGFVSGFIIFVNRPYKYGDFIQINEAKGYVKSISLMETTIETPDNNTLILPNHYITQSIIQNYTYQNKAYQKVHILYDIHDFNDALEEDIKNKVTDFLIENGYVARNNYNQITYLFSLHPQLTNAFRFEIIFSLNNKIDLKKELTNVHRKIYEILKDMKLELQFEDIHYPFK